MRVVPRILVVTCVLLALFLSVGLALADERESSWLEERVALRMVAHLESRLAMTDEQRAQVTAILARERPVMRSLYARTQREREELSAMHAFDEAETREILSHYDADNTNVLVERSKIRTELRAILTDKQRARMDAIRRRFGAEFVDRVGELAEVL